MDSNVQQHFKLSQEISITISRVICCFTCSRSFSTFAPDVPLKSARCPALLLQRSATLRERDYCIFWQVTRMFFTSAGMWKWSVRTCKYLHTHWRAQQLCKHVILNFDNNTKLALVNACSIGTQTSLRSATTDSVDMGTVWAKNCYNFLHKAPAFAMLFGADVFQRFCPKIQRFYSKAPALLHTRDHWHVSSFSLDTSELLSRHTTCSTSTGSTFSIPTSCSTVCA